MKTTKDNPSVTSQSGKRHPVRQKLLSSLLCVCLLLVSLPMEFYGFEVQAEEPCRQILSFSDSPQEIMHQTPEPGDAPGKPEPAGNAGSSLHSPGE
ncbi:hypothetical protein VSQ32_05575 [Lachnospiraceae bacterium KK002]